jgi:sialate O-acetylesterase
LKTPDGSKVNGFTISGADKKFVFADATIEGDSVIVSSPQVKEPAAVRYGWHEHPIVNLYNGVDLPAVPFRTDSK